MDKVMDKEKLHELLKQAKGAISASLARAPAALVLLAAASMPMKEALAWTSQWENVGRQVGREAGRSAAGGGNDSSARLGDLIGGVVGAAMTRPIDDEAKAKEQARREAERAEREAARAAEANRRRLEQAEMAGRERAVREQAYQAERGRWTRVTPGPAAGYPAVSSDGRVAMDRFNEVQRHTGGTERTQEVHRPRPY